MKARPFRAGLVWGRYSQGVALGYRMAPRWGEGGMAIIMRPLARRPVSERGKTEQVHQRARRWPQHVKMVRCTNGIGVGRNAAKGDSPGQRPGNKAPQPTQP